MAFRAVCGDSAPLRAFRDDLFPHIWVRHPNILRSTVSQLRNGGFDGRQMLPSERAMRLDLFYLLAQAVHARRPVAPSANMQSSTTPKPPIICVPIVMALNIAFAFE